MKKGIIFVVIILILIAGAICFLLFKNEPKKEENKVNTIAENSGSAEVEAEIEDEHSEIDPDVDIDLDSVPLDLNDEEKEELNKKLNEYNGKTLNLEDTKELINRVIEINDEFVGDGKRFISINDNDYNNVDNKLFMRCLDANPYYNGNNTKEDVEDAKEQMEKYRDSLEEESYKITFVKGRDIVEEINIEKE